MNNCLEDNMEEILPEGIVKRVIVTPPYDSTIILDYDGNGRLVNVRHEGEMLQKTYRNKLIKY